MGNTLTLAYNKLQYMTAKNLSDPEADNYAKQQAAQAKQDAEAKKRKIEAAKNASEAEQQKKEAQEAALELQKRSQFSSVSENMAKASDGIIKVFISIALIAIILYGGYISANKAIGYSISFRLVSFLYGCLCFFYVIPQKLIDIYYYKNKFHHYAFLPLSTHVPIGNVERFFIGAFCYTEDDISRAAKEEVRRLYESGFNKSLKAVAETVTAVGAIAGAAVAANSNNPTKPASSSNKTSNDPKPLEPSPGNTVIPEVKPQVNNHAAPEVKPQVNKDAAPEVKPQVNNHAAPEVKPQVNKDAAPEVKPQVNKDAAPEAKSDTKLDAKPDAKPDAKSDETPVATPVVTPKSTPPPTPPASPQIKPTEVSGPPQLLRALYPPRHVRR